MKVAVYIRVSKRDQHPENQELKLRDYCERMNWSAEFFQEKESTRKTRPVQYALYQRLLRKEFDAVLIYKYDRWARSSRELITHLEELKARGVAFISFTENIDTTTPMGKMFLTFLAGFAEFERDIIRERTLAGLERARAQGKKLGRPKKKRGAVIGRE